MAKTKRAPRPAKKPDAIIQAALKAYNMALPDRAVLDGRLPSGLLDHLAADLSALGEQVVAAPVALDQQKAATVSERVALASAHRRISAIRNAISHAGLNSDARKAWGVGQRLSDGDTTSVRAAGQLIVARAASKPAEAALAGVLPTDVDALNADLALIGTTSTDQQSKRAARPLTTAARNTTARALEDAVRRISAAGRNGFVTDQKKHDAYAALWRGKKAKKAAAVAPATATAATR